MSNSLAQLLLGTLLHYKTYQKCCWWNLFLHCSFPDTWKLDFHWPCSTASLGSNLRSFDTLSALMGSIAVFFIFYGTFMQHEDHERSNGGHRSTYIRNDWFIHARTQLFHQNCAILQIKCFQYLIGYFV